MSIQIKKGSVLIYRVFDIAEEINLSQVEELLKSAVGGGRLKLTRTPRQLVIMRNAPVTFSLGETEIQIDQQTFKAEVFGKIWDYGVLTLMFQIAIPEDSSMTQIVEFAVKLELNTSIDDLARARSEELMKIIAPALRDQHYWPEFEDYVIYFFEELNGIKNTNEFIERAEPARLIVAENSVTLAERSKKSIVESTYQYSDQDLTILDWNSAIVIEPSGRKEVPEVIEFALTQLMEMRYYDALLDERLTALYDEIEESRSKFFNKKILRLSNEASARYIEFSEFIERVDNSFKVVGDFYLAKIFRAAGEEFRIPEWEQNVTRKMNLFASISQILQGDINVKRSLWLEITIVVLIMFEIIAAIFRFY